MSYNVCNYVVQMTQLWCIEEKLFMRISLVVIIKIKKIKNCSEKKNLAHNIIPVIIQNIKFSFKYQIFR